MVFYFKGFARRRAPSLATILLLLLLACYYLTTLPQLEAANVAITNRSVEDWTVQDLEGRYSYRPLYFKNHSVVPHDDVGGWPVQTYYWRAPEPYYQWKIYTYGGHLQFLVSHIVTRGDTSGKYLDEPDLVLEGGPRDHHMKVGYLLPNRDEKDMLEGYDKNQTIVMPLSEPGWYHLRVVEEVVGADKQPRQRLKLSLDEPVSRADFSLVLAGLDRSLIRAKYHMDQVEGDLYDVDMGLKGNKSRTVECDNDCSGVLLDDLDDIGLLFDEIRRLAPMLKDGPWRRLAYLKNRTNSLGEALDQYLRLIGLGREVMDNYASNFDQETLADLIELRANNLDSRAPGIATEAYTTRLLAQRTLDELLKGLWDKIRKIIKQLDEQGFGPQGVSLGRIERIVAESEIILRELRNRNLKPYLDDAERELRRAKALLDKIQTLLIDPEKSAELLKRLEQLQKVLVDFSRIVQDQVLKPVEKANELVSEGKKKYQALLALLKEAEERGKESQNSLDEARRLLEITKKCLLDEANYLDQLPRQLTDLNNSIHEIEVRRSILTQVNPDYQRRYVDKCREHGEGLMNKSRQLDGLFNATRDVADYALRAANVYKNIIAAIEKAEKAARRALDAAEEAYKVAVPDFGESLADKAREAKRKSLELLDKAKKLRDQDIQRLSLELAKRKQIIDQLFEDIKSLVHELDQINAGLKQLADKNFLEQLQEIDAFLKRLLERLAQIHKRLQLLNDLIYNSLLPQFERLSAGSQSSLGNLSQVIDLTRKDLMAAIKYSSSSKVSLERLLKLEAKLDIDLDLLRRKIQLAHQEAGSVHVSIMAPPDSGFCTRSYFLPSALSSHQGGVSVGGFYVRELSLIWSLHSEDAAESMLLFLGTKTGDEFLALEMYERRLRLVYQLNSYSSANQPQVLQHQRQVDLNDRGLLSDEAWYLISVSVSQDDSRISLSVKPVPRAHEKDPQQVSQRLTPVAGARSSRLITSPYGEADLHFYVGGLPSANEFTPPSEIKSTRLTGCLYNLALNEQQVGLWNFKTNAGCEGCMEGPQVASAATSSSAFSFTGAQSYALVTQQRPQYDRTKYMVSMNVKTGDSDALLFLTLSEHSNHYLSVSMSKGRVAFLVGKLSPNHVNYLSLTSGSLFDHVTQAHLLHSMNNNSQATSALQQQPMEHLVVTSKEYNNNQWFRITAEKDQNKVILAVEDEYKESVVDDKLLTLDMDQVFFGGAWPMLRPKKFANTSIEFNSLAGCLKDIQIEASPIDLLRRQSYGVEMGCPATRTKTLSSIVSPLTRVAYPLPVGR